MSIEEQMLNQHKQMAQQSLLMNIQNRVISQWVVSAEIVHRFSSNLIPTLDQQSYCAIYAVRTGPETIEYMAQVKYLWYDLTEAELHLILTSQGAQNDYLKEEGNRK